MTFVDEYKTLAREHRGIYKFVADNIVGPNALSDLVDRCMKTQQSFPSVDAFLDKWLSQYRNSDRSVDPEKRGWRGDDPNGAVGFMLYYMNPVQGTPYFEIGTWKGVNVHTGHPEGMIMAADTNGIINEAGMQLTVNDIEHRRVLAYNSQSRIRPYNQLRMLPEWNEGNLIEGISAWELNSAEFPVESPNPAKTFSRSWTMIGIQPPEVYKVLRRLGFVFPKPGERTASYRDSTRRDTR